MHEFSNCTAGHSKYPSMCCVQMEMGSVPASHLMFAATVGETCGEKLPGRK